MSYTHAGQRGKDRMSGNCHCPMVWSSSGALQRITEIGEEAEEEDRRIVFAVSV